MPNRPDTDLLRAHQAGITRLVERDLTAFFGSLNLDKPEAARDALLRFVPSLVDTYGESAASVSADWYDDQRANAGIRSRFASLLGTPVKAEVVESQVRFGASHLFTLNPDQTLAFLLGASTKYALAPGRETVTTSAVADPAARGWARFTRAGSCDFCTMLTGRGAVYTEATAGFDAHGHCHCAAGPVWA